MAAMSDHAPPTTAPAIDDFLRRWAASGASERANYQLFLTELCDVLGVGRPEPAGDDHGENAYVFERAVTFHDPDGQTRAGRIDLYKRGCFVLEAKQGSDRKARDAAAGAGGLALPRAGRRGTAVRGTTGWDAAMVEARGQAEQYARALPTAEGWPPFLIVVDVGHTIELFADFSRSGRTYVVFPDAKTHRIKLAELADAGVRERLRLAWTAPLELDPGRRAAKVTREVAAKLAAMARSLEASGHAPQAVADFLMRCLFTMFAEDVGLLPREGFTGLLRGRKGRVETFPAMVGSLWKAMNDGEFSPILERKVLRFKGQLFPSAAAPPPLAVPQLDLLSKVNPRKMYKISISTKAGSRGLTKTRLGLPFGRLSNEFSKSAICLLNSGKL